MIVTPSSISPPGRRGLPLAVFLLMTAPGMLLAEPIEIPNGSFESPATLFVDANIDYWQKTSEPDWYDDRGGFLWSQLTGTFKNSEPGAFDHITNCDGGQAIWLFAVPEVGLFQDYDSIDWNDAEPSRAFDARFEPGRSYTLTAGIIGGGGGMSNGVTLEISLYFRDPASNVVTVAATSITNTPALFGDRTRLVDFQVNLPAVNASDPWAGQQIGAGIRSTVGFELMGGYWDVDNLRLNSLRGPVLLNSSWVDEQFTFTLNSEPGLAFELLGAENLALPLDQWTRLGTVTNSTGQTHVMATIDGGPRGFFQVQQVQ